MISSKNAKFLFCFQILRCEASLSFIFRVPTHYPKSNSNIFSSIPKCISFKAFPPPNSCGNYIFVYSILITALLNCIKLYAILLQTTKVIICDRILQKGDILRKTQQGYVFWNVSLVCNTLGVLLNLNVKQFQAFYLNPSTCQSLKTPH